MAQGNGSFSAYPGHDVTFRRTRARDNICSSQAGRGKPMSGGLVWDEDTFEVVEIAPEDFSPRLPIRLTFPWDNGG